MYLPPHTGSAKWVVAICACLTLLLQGGCKFLEGYAEARSARIATYEVPGIAPEVLGAARFLFDDVGGLNTRTLETNAMSWKVVMTALAMEHTSRNSDPIGPGLPAIILQQYGWITPTGIDNWPQGPAPTFDKPVGLIAGELRLGVPRVRLEVANMGCAACHAGMSYDAQGSPTGRLWLGSPNTSRYFDGYLRAIVAGLVYVKDREEELMRNILVVFPEVHPEELATIRKRVIPLIRERLGQAERGEEILIGFGHGGPGLTNGIAALKLRLDTKPGLLTERELGYASIPDLYGRWMRSAVLYDGLYAMDQHERFVSRAHHHVRSAVERAQFSSIVAFFIVPSLGVAADATEPQTARISDMVTFLDAYRPQPFPGSINQRTAERGSKVYAAHCASCHGAYSPGTENVTLLNFPNRLVPQAEMNTDPERWRAITDRMVRALGSTPVAAKINAASARGYVAPILNGLWASAPYFHNGSVPTIWHLLRPEKRPKRFMVGGHRLDFIKLGIAGEMGADAVYRYPSGYLPWSIAQVYDVNEPGKSNAGHESEFRVLSDTQKDDLLEYLKLL
jgi:mono/diheme cytochrome c family protein